MISHSHDPITPEHRAREALVYPRQSSRRQLRRYTESTSVQLSLTETAIKLGWPNPILIKDDLGISAKGFAERPGFQQMMAKVTTKQVGIIVCFDASRLSRNSKDWAHLFELCGFFNTLVVDLDRIYDLSIPDDRMVLGIKGTISEMEYAVLRGCLRAAIEAKAARGELRTNIPVGYIYDHSGKLVFDPNKRVQNAMTLMFEQFDRSTSARQLALWYRDTKTLFPLKRNGENSGVSWEIPRAQLLLKLLTHPIYTGTYTWGRYTTRVEYCDGKLVKRVVGVPMEEWDVCIHDHHAAYISWERFLANRAKLKENRPRRNMEENRGAIRAGLALLAGICRCGHCGKRMYVQYKRTSALYCCDGKDPRCAARCLSFGSKVIDQAVSQELCRAVEPFALEAAILAAEQKEEERSQEIRNVTLQVEAAQYEADRAFEQFNLVDPKNRLVADTLENQWNDKLGALQEAKERLQAVEKGTVTLSEDQKKRLENLAGHFEQVWNHAEADPILKKRIVRAAIEEIIVVHQKEETRLEVTIHWKGGTHTRIYVKKRVTPVGRKADPDLVRTVGELAQTLGDGEIARILNMKRVETPTGLRWTKDRVRDFRHHHHLRSKAASSWAQEETLGLKGAAQYLGISRRGLLKLVAMGAVSKNQVTDFAPCRIRREELDSEHVQKLVRILKATGRLPKGGCSKNQLTLFDDA
jgi:DNA invertase Pin-like site-specific DNA recombinase